MEEPQSILLVLFSSFVQLLFLISPCSQPDFARILVPPSPFSSIYASAGSITFLVGGNGEYEGNQCSHQYKKVPTQLSQQTGYARAAAGAAGDVPAPAMAAEFLVYIVSIVAGQSAQEAADRHQRPGLDRHQLVGISRAVAVAATASHYRDRSRTGNSPGSCCWLVVLRGKP
jgi:hypothetical protein